MKHKAAGPRRKTNVARPKPPAGAHNRRQRADAEQWKPPRTPSRTLVRRLAAEVDALAAQLEESRARILDLEARVDVDWLTGALNRRGFERALNRSIAYVKRYGATAALVYLDLDDFKPINDRHGHAAGDTVLKAVAAALTRHVRASDVVARIGGDEFVVLLWNVDPAAAAAKAAALEAVIYATPVRWGSSVLGIGASAGITAVGPLNSANEVLARADAAMYARKRERPTSAARRGRRRRIVTFAVRAA